MIGSKVLDCAYRDSGKVILKTCNHVVTYKQLAERILQMKDCICSYGMENQEPIGLAFPNSMEFVTSMLAAELAGHPAVLLGAMLKPREINFHIRHSGTRIVLANSSLSQYMHEAGGELTGSLFDTIECWRFDNENTSDKFKSGDFICQLTSGTNGISKGVVRTSEAVFTEVNETIHEIKLNDRDIVLTIPPIHHSYGLIAGILAPLCSAAQVILLDGFISADVKKIIETERATILLAVPFMYHLLNQMKGIQQTDFSSLRLCLSAGAPMHEEVAKTFQRCFGKIVSQDYGSTETGVMCLNFNPDKITNTVGKPVGSRLIRTFGENGEILPYGEKGELRTLSKADTRAYIYPEELNKTAFKDGWLGLGDIGWVDTNGYVYVSGRKSNMINVAGMKVDPEEVEKVIMAIPGIKETAVVGVNASVGGHVVKAFIVAEDKSMDKSLIIQHCRKNLSSFKIPRSIEFIEELPRSQTGKILRKHFYSID